MADTAPVTVRLSFWDSATGKAILRIGKLVLAALVAGLIVQYDKDNTIFGVAYGPVVYFALSTVQDFLNPKVPNTANDIHAGDTLP